MASGKIKMHVVPHTHWDREWYFTLEEYRYRLVRLFDLLIESMESGKIKYFTLDGQTIALRDYIERRPENRERLMALTKSGRLQIGPYYTQPNVFMSCGEAQLRNLEWGQRDVDMWGGGLNVNYMPDQFGFHTQVPQITRGFGMECMVGGRGMDKGSDVYFDWEGPDGSVVRAIAMPHSYINAHNLSDRDQAEVYDVFGCKISMAPLSDIMGMICAEIPRLVTDNLLALNGVDHMFPNPELESAIAKINRDYPQFHAEQSTFGNYIADVEAALTAPLKHKTGELRDPRENLILPASQSMRMDVKLRNAYCEDYLIRLAEPKLAIMKALGQKRLPETDLSAAWELLLQNHAHDSLCCSNSEPSYREIMTRYDKISDIARESVTDMEQHFIRLIEGMPDKAVVVWNPSPFDRDEPVSFDIITAYYRKFAEPHLYVDGAEIPCHINGIRTDTLLRFVPFSGRVGELQVVIWNVTADPGVIPATGYKTIEIRGGGMHARPVDGLVRGQRMIENEYLRVMVNADATLDVLDKRSGELYSGVNVFIDDGEAGNGFQHISPYRDFTAVSCGENMTVRIVENSPQRGTILIGQDFTLPKSLSADGLSRSDETVKTHIETAVTLRRGCAYVEFDTKITNAARDHRLRVGFPTDVKSDTAYVGQPFDVVLRPVQPENVNELHEGDYEPYVGYGPMHDFCGITDGRRGAAVAGGGLLEYEVLPMRRTLTVTLLRATDRLLVGVLATGSKFRLPAAQLLGEMRYRYAFIPHTGGYENVLRDVEASRHQLNVFQKDFLEEQTLPGYTAPKPILPLSCGYIRIEGSAVMTALKPSSSGDEDTVLRIFNPLCSESVSKITVDDHYILNGAELVRMDERVPEDRPIPFMVEGNTTVLTLGPKQIATIKLNVKIKN